MRRSSRGFDPIDCPVGPKSYLIRGSLDLLVLSVLSRRAMRCPAIAACIERRSRDHLCVVEAQLHRSLGLLRQKGWVSSLGGWPDDEGGECRYRLTAKGRKQLQGEAAAWHRLAGAVSAVVR